MEPLTPPPSTRLLDYVSLPDHHSDLPLMLFIHGWPDSSALWNRFTEALGGHYSCVCVTLPGFDDSTPLDSTEAPSFCELTDRLGATVKQLLKELKQDQLILVGHDWGAYLCYLFEARATHEIRALVTFDVGGEMDVKSVGQAAFVVGYQWWLILGWWVGKWFPRMGDGMSRAFARLARAPYPRRAKSRMGYIYFKFWRGLFFNDPKEKIPKPYDPVVPTLFLFGAAKRYMFHSNEWILRLSQRANNEVSAVPRTGHWLLVEDFNTCYSVVKAWLKNLE